MFALILLGFAAVASASDTNRCLQEADGGMCRGYFEMFYYDYNSKTCKEFVYGGCQGNDNRFASEEDCMKACGDVVVWQSSDVCELPSESGPCMAYMPRYYFDRSTGQCKQFIYGGCRGNANNFRTSEECQRTCGGTIGKSPNHQDSLQHSARTALNTPPGQSPTLHQDSLQQAQLLLEQAQLHLQQIQLQFQQAELQFQQAQLQLQLAQLQHQQAQIHSRENPLQLQQAQLQLTQAKFHLQQAELRLQQAQLRLQQAQLRLQEAQLRVQQSQFPHQAQLQVQLAELQLQQAQLHLQQTKLQSQQAQLQVQQSQLQLQQAQLQYQQAQLQLQQAQYKQNPLQLKQAQLQLQQAQLQLQQAIMQLQQAQLLLQPVTLRGQEAQLRLQQAQLQLQQAQLKPNRLSSNFNGLSSNSNQPHSEAREHTVERSECEKPPETGLCKASMPRYFFDKSSMLCKIFIYGGCGGNGNNFKTEEECYDNCGVIYGYSACQQEKERGQCLGYFPRYYYNKEAGKCEKFIYGGCQGNDNNFESQEDCEATCLSS